MTTQERSPTLDKLASYLDETFAIAQNPEKYMARELRKEGDNYLLRVDNLEERTEVDLLLPVSKAEFYLENLDFRAHFQKADRNRGQKRYQNKIKKSEIYRFIGLAIGIPAMLTALGCFIYGTIYNSEESYADPFSNSMFYLVLSGSIGVLATGLFCGAADAQEIKEKHRKELGRNNVEDNLERKLEAGE